MCKLNYPKKQELPPFLHEVFVSEVTIINLIVISYLCCSTDRCSLCK